MNIWALPRLRTSAFSVWHRNLLVWKKLIGPAILMNFGEPTLYLLGLGFGLGHFIGEMGNMPYLTFLASGIIASTAMTVSSFEGMYSVFTRMVPQRTYEAMMSTPLDIDDIIAGEMLWCATKSMFSGIAILLVALLLGVVEGWQAIWVIPVVFLTGLCFAGPAIVMSSVSPSYDFFSYYFVLVVTPMFIMSGVFYPVETLPGTIQGVVQILPLNHAVSLTRPLIAGQEVIQPLVHISVLALYAVIGYYFAVAMVKRRLLV